MPCCSTTCHRQTMLMVCGVTWCSNRPCAIICTAGSVLCGHTWGIHQPCLRLHCPHRLKRLCVSHCSKSFCHLNALHSPMRILQEVNASRLVCKTQVKRLHAMSDHGMPFDTMTSSSAILSAIPFQANAVNLRQMAMTLTVYWCWQQGLHKMRLSQWSVLPLRQRELKSSTCVPGSLTSGQLAALMIHNCKPMLCMAQPKSESCLMCAKIPSCFHSGRSACRYTVNNVSVTTPPAVVQFTGITLDTLYQAGARK